VTDIPSLSRTPTIATRCKYIGIYIGIYVYISVCPRVCTCVYLHIYVLDEVLYVSIHIYMNLFYILNKKRMLLHIFSRRMVAYILVCVVLLVDVCEYYCVCLCTSARATLREFFCEGQCFVAKIPPTNLSWASVTWLVHWVCCFDDSIRNSLVALLEDVFGEQVICICWTSPLCLVNKSFVFVETQKMYLLNKDVFVFVEQVIWRISTESFRISTEVIPRIQQVIPRIEQVIPRIPRISTNRWTSHATHMNQQTDHIWINKQIYLKMYLLICVEWLVHVHVITCSNTLRWHVWRDSFTGGTWLDDTSNMTGAMCLCVCVCVCVRAWVCVYIFACACCVYACVCASVCGTTRLYVWDIPIHKRAMIYSRICVCIRHVTHVCVWHDSFVCLRHTHSYMWHDTSTYVLINE